eukprot:3740858-Rhodomonas_salina.1
MASTNYAQLPSPTSFRHRRSTSIATRVGGCRTAAPWAGSLQDRPQRGLGQAPIAWFTLVEVVGGYHPPTPDSPQRAEPRP